MVNWKSSCDRYKGSTMRIMESILGQMSCNV